ncbi:hypothetical protein [Haloprofundus halobius]|uniref:DNA replication complex subunit Gins51 n=1 Tax=Haloprofundus halobius TaxID=2876194 RepID=UPI001CCBF9DC|nr:hypothetical protein [Haloprofundus halobius]
MNLDELRTVQSKERRKDGLQQLRDSFYADVAEYIAGLKAERKCVADEVDDPFSSPEVGRLTDEIETAEEVIEAVYERRVGKVVKLASFAAADMPVDEDGFTSEERALFDDLVARIDRNKSTVLDILSGRRTPERDAGRSETADSATAATDAGDATGADPVADATPDVVSDARESPGADSGDVLADAMGDRTGADGSEDVDTSSPSPDTPAPDAESTPIESETGGTSGTADTSSQPVPPDTPDPEAGGETSADSPSDDAAEGDIERTTVRITHDVGTIFGVDEREYDLAAEDVVTLPTTNAEPLLARDAAERLD